ncbi:MAG TPA: DUF1385 domain-containing protein [Candidatus Dormibacteraeota bacterium]|nr:DUF1385 domain-containing protein [Candidatus Dormibacteraeota bacterium]
MAGAAAVAEKAARPARTRAEEPFFYGGQAVIEGVLMRGPRHWACAARRPDGEIVLVEEPLHSAIYTSRFWALPFLRGIAGLVEMMHLGTRAIRWSANIQARALGIEISKRTMRLSMAAGVVLAIGLFFGLPLATAGLLHHGDRGTGFGLVEGGARAVIVLGYLALISAIPSIGRLFAYHGAEHKTINCFESGEPVTVENVRRASRLHPRCGTGFIVVVVFVSLIVLVPLAGLPLPLLVLSRLAFVPFIAAVSYEAIRALARIRRTPVGRVLLVPVLAGQRLTTREPDDSMIEVAITALAAARRATEGAGTPLPIAS